MRRCGCGTRLPVSPFGDPLTGHTNPRYGGGDGRVGDRDVIVSGSRDRTCGCGTRHRPAPSADPLTGHTRQVASGSDRACRRPRRDRLRQRDQTVRMWDVRHRSARSANPLTGHTRSVDGGGGRACRRPQRHRLGSRDRTVRDVGRANRPAPIGEPTQRPHPARCVTIALGLSAAATSSSPAAWIGRCGCGTPAPVAGRTPHRPPQPC